MARSMTGFGRAIMSRGYHELKIEMKSVNHRYLDINLRLPRDLSSLETGLRKQISDRVSRGKLDVFISYSNRDPVANQLEVDESKVLVYQEAYKTLAACLGEKSPTLTLELARLPEIFKLPDRDWASEVAPLLAETLTATLDELDHMRSVEGRQLLADLSDKLEDLARHVAVVERLAPDVIEKFRQRLQSRLTELLQDQKEEYYPEQRVATELAIFADKVGIDEELVRLKSHIKQFSSSLQSDGPIGKRLDFLVQEMNREVNTIGSKANNLEITQEVVELKTIIEQVREQVQNLE